MRISKHDMPVFRFSFMKRIQFHNKTLETGKVSPQKQTRFWDRVSKW